MSQFRSAIKVMSLLTPAVVAKDIREIVATFEDPKLQNETAFLRADGRVLTIAQAKIEFGPTYATDPVLLEQLVSAYIGRYTRQAFQKFGINPATLAPEKMMVAFEATADCERAAIRLLTAN